MGLSMQDIARLVVELEPPVCPVCNVKGFADWAAAQVISPPEGEVGEAVIITYHCKACDTSIHTFA